MRETHRRGTEQARRRYGSARLTYERRPATSTSENSVWTKFAGFNVSALGRSFFNGGASAQTRAHRPDGQCKRIRLRHLLCPATTCSTPMQVTRLLDRVCCCQAFDHPSGAFYLFTGFAGKKRADERTRTAASSTSDI